MADHVGLSGSSGHGGKSWFFLLSLILSTIIIDDLIALPRTYQAFDLPSSRDGHRDWHDSLCLQRGTLSTTCLNHPLTYFHLLPLRRGIPREYPTNTPIPHFHRFATIPSTEPRGPAHWMIASVCMRSLIQRHRKRVQVSQEATISDLQEQTKSLV